MKYPPTEDSARRVIAHMVREWRRHGTPISMWEQGWFTGASLFWSAATFAQTMRVKRTLRDRPHRQDLIDHANNTLGCPPTAGIEEDL